MTTDPTATTALLAQRLEKFAREATALADLCHPNTPSGPDIWENRGSYSANDAVHQLAPIMQEIDRLANSVAVQTLTERLH